MNPMNYYSIDVLVSTFEDRVAQLEGRLPEPIPGVRYLVGHQIGDGSHYEGALRQRADVTYIAMMTKGVTKSRNELLSISLSDLIYFCDDDIWLNPKFFELLREYHNRYKEGIITFRVDNTDGSYRKKPLAKQYARRGWFNILSVGTVEISLKTSACTGLTFDSDMGAGSVLQIGDEAVFLASALRRGILIGFVNQCIATHPQDSSGFGETNLHLYARGLTIRKVYGVWFGFPLVLLFFIRRYSRSKHNLSEKYRFLVLYLKGFWKMTINDYLLVD
jgi:glycosyltransferase involved in cell wall biosynthesis